MSLCSLGAALHQKMPPDAALDFSLLISETLASLGHGFRGRPGPQALGQSLSSENPEQGELCLGHRDKRGGWLGLQSPGPRTSSIIYCRVIRPQFSRLEKKVLNQMTFKTLPAPLGSQKSKV